MRIILVSSLLSSIALGGCSTLGWDKERITEQRKQELCRDVSTRDLPHCAGGKPTARELDF